MTSIPTFAALHPNRFTEPPATLPIRLADKPLDSLLPEARAWRGEVKTLSSALHAETRSSTHLPSSLDALARQASNLEKSGIALTAQHGVLESDAFAGIRGLRNVADELFRVHGLVDPAPANLHLAATLADAAGAKASKFAGGLVGEVLRLVK